MIFDWRGGAHLIGSDLWFDAERAPGLTFVSHAGIRATGARLLTSGVTAKVLRAMGRRARPLAPPFGRPLTIGAHRVELLPSDLLPGAALLRVENAGGTAIYAGALGKGADVRACDELCLLAPASTEGVPIESVARIVAEANGEISVLLAPGLAEAYAAARALNEAKAPLCAHPSLRTAFRALGVSVPALRDSVEPGEAVLWPLDRRHDRALARLPRARSCVLGPACATPAVMADYARATGAARVVVAGRHAVALASRLRSEGITARAISGPDQLGLFSEFKVEGAPA